MSPQKQFWFAVGRSQKVFEVTAPSAYAAKSIMSKFIADPKNGYGWNTQFELLPACPVRKPKKLTSCD
ncbi:hypothetical protein EM858_14475 [Agrobacterium sp. CNPSo 2736]|uniref:hypothetical protein n=1 Tax=Agrobacterium sp. CNPSo 2736 TaxID=2499627 RepID=UPI000FD891F3|nr:hypothetical protein [Agrobacterium sp. CNPSo 2736]RVT75649.1 hypothetical protein EM858_14475 [Agrobacterium sp. CNPSo 2736]